MSSANDYDVVMLARKIEIHMTAIQTLIQNIKSLDHPKADQIASALWDQCYQPAWATHVIHTRLDDPSRWVTGDFGIRRITTRKATP